MMYLNKSTIYLLIISLIFISGCGHSRYAYIYDPQIIHKDGWDIGFYQYHVEFSETQKCYIGIERKTQDTLYEFSISFSTKDTTIARNSFIRFDNVNIYIGKNRTPVKTYKMEEYLKPFKTDYFNQVDFGLIRTTGPLPEQMFTEMDIIIYNINNGEEIKRYHIETTGTLTKFFKSYIEDFIDGY